MDSLNTFEGGMQSDLSKYTTAKNTYRQALNFRPICEGGGDSTSSLVNIKGNECKITFPTTQDIFKLKVVENISGVGGNDIITIDMGIFPNIYSTPTIEIDNNTTGLSIYNELKALPNCFESTHISPVTPAFAVAYKGDYVIIYQQPEYKDCGPLVNSIFPKAVVNRTVVDPNFTLLFEAQNSTNQNTQTNPYILTHNNIRVIGSTFIDEDLYLLTEDEPLGIIPEHDSFTGASHIWKLSIDDVTKQHTLRLLYTNLLDFTIEHPIPPSAILGRYESKEIKRIYWTDFYNKIRTCNVADEQLMALDPTQLSIIPSFNFELPILQDIPSGSLSVGTYELAYRLKKIAGAVTNFTQPSNMVQLVSADPNNMTAAGFAAYQGSPDSDSTRGITWKLDNVDTDFDTIEFVVLQRTNKTNLARVYSIPELNTLESMTITVTDLTNYDEILLEEYISLQAGFNYAKTVDTKDNRLFWGNVKNDRQDISNLFDARAFRAKTAGLEDIKLKNNGIISTYTLNDAIDLPQTSDAINNYYEPDGDEDTVNACYYKPNDPSNKLGGKGKYIEYEFFTQEVLLSNFEGLGGPSGDWNIQSSYPFSNRGALSGIPINYNLINTGSDSDNQIYHLKGVNACKNPYVISALKGFQHEEIYRFGIQFFDDQGFPMFTEWIGDIKFPKYNDSNPGSTTGDFRNSFLSGYSAMGQILGIKFTVDVSTISKTIGSYQIVRVERTESDKSIITTGIITQPRTDSNTGTSVLGGGLWYNPVSAIPLFPEHFPSFLAPLPISPNAIFGYSYFPDPSQNALETLCPDPVVGSGDGETGAGSKVMTIDSFDFLTNGYTFKSNDRILVRSILQPINRQHAHGGVGDPRYRKSFDSGDWLLNGATLGQAPEHLTPGYGVRTGALKWQTGFDSEHMPYFMNAYVDCTLPSNLTRKVYAGQFVESNSSTVINDQSSSYTFLNRMRNYGNPSISDYKLDGVPGYGSPTVLFTIDTTSDSVLDPTTLGVNAESGNKLFVLYYRPNLNQYGGNTYTSRTNNVYIPCGSLIPIKRDNNTLINNTNISFKCFGGDIHLNYHDHQKVYKHIEGDGVPPANFLKYNYSGSGDPGNNIGDVGIVAFNMSVSYFFPCTNSNNQAVRYGNHIDANLTADLAFVNDQYNYANYHSNEKNILTFFPKPLKFQTTDEWRARIFFSEIKFDNESQDSWTIYPPNNFYDVEGNYGGINCLISLVDQMYYLQDRAIGQLTINPIAQVDGGIGKPIQLGGTGDVITSHNHIALDVGTRHQWSVYRSSKQFLFLDARHKKIYSFGNGGLRAISDLYGQRNFTIKRLHDNILAKDIDDKFIGDNPIKSTGVITTYDYYHNEFLITFLDNTDVTSTEEYYTIAFSEFTDRFTSYYSFAPNIYLNSNKYLFSNTNDTNRIASIRTKIYLHNFGNYGTFYDNLLNTASAPYPSTLKVVNNEQPLQTKVYDNISWMSDSIDDNLEWSDDNNIYPGAITNPTYPDDINYHIDTFTKLRCYNDYQNSDFVTLTTVKPNNNLRRVERAFNAQVPRNKFNYDSNNPSTYSIFDPARLTKTTFGERLRDKYLTIDLSYPNTINNRFVIHNLKTSLRISDR